MNNIEEKIKDYLNKEYNYHVKIHGESRILGTFVVGACNYGFAESVKDIHFVTIYLPTFEELCLGDLRHNGTATDFGYLYDIRSAYNVSTDCTSTILEILFCDNYIITSQYKNLFEDSFLKNRELIARVNPHNRIYKTLSRIERAFDNNDIFEGVRLALATKLYSKGVSVNDCYHIKDTVYINYLWNCKHNTIEVDTNAILNEIQTIAEETEEGINYKVDSLLKRNVVTLISRSLRENISMDTFISCLTQTEKQAWSILKNLIVDGAVVISISKIIEETGISRPVWKSLLQKLEQDEIASVNNQGVKGTYIKMR